MRAPLVLASLGLFGMLLAGCDAASEDECANVRSDCPNEPSLVAECRAEAAVCPASARAVFLCLAAHQVCDGRGKLDRTRSLGFCAEQVAEDQRCRGVDASAPVDSGSPDTGAADTSVDDAGDEVSKPDAKSGG